MGVLSEFFISLRIKKLIPQISELRLKKHVKEVTLRNISTIYLQWV